MTCAGCRGRLETGPGPSRAGDPERLAAALTGIRLPDGHGHAYLFGEAKVVLALREMVANRGLAAEQVSPKAYWGRGKANASHGEPARDS